MEARVGGSNDRNSPAVEVRIRAVSSDGSGVGDLPDGLVVFVHRTAPNDRVRIRVHSRKDRWARGTLEEVVESGEERTTPPCPYYALCGGCTLQHLSYEAQLHWKGRFIADALARIGGIDRPLPDVRPSPHELGYRSRVTFTVLRLGRDRVVAGLHRVERPSHLVDLPDACLIADPRINRAWEHLRRSWGPGARRLPGGRKLRLTLMAADEGVALMVAGGRGKGDLRGLIGTDSGLIAVWRVEPGGQARLIAGEANARATRMGEVTTVDPRVFLQVNAGAAELLHADVIRSIPNPRGLTVVDAYCGTGLYGRHLARQGAVVVGLESDRAAVRAALEGAPPDFRVLEGRVEDRLSEALPADVVIMNPPRAGLDRVVPELLSNRPARLLVYVSCDPATLARDLERLAGAYEIDQVLAFDLFPQTAHVETMVTLTPRRTPG